MLWEDPTRKDGKPRAEVKRYEAWRKKELRRLSRVRRKERKHAE